MTCLKKKTYYERKRSKQRNRDEEESPNTRKHGNVLPIICV